MDFFDSYSNTFKMVGKEIQIEDVARAFFLSAPIWIHSLFIIRNRLVGFIGLKTGNEMKVKLEGFENKKFEVGERVGLFLF